MCGQNKMQGESESIAQAEGWEDVVFRAMGAYDSLARHIIMEDRGPFTKSQIDVLMILGIFGTLNMTQVSECLAASKEQASRAVAPLVERGLVKRERNSERYRVVDVSLTEAGKRFLEDERRRHAERLRERLSSVSTEDREKLVRASKAALEVLVRL